MNFSYNLTSSLGLEYFIRVLITSNIWFSSIHAYKSSCKCLPLKSVPGHHGAFITLPHKKNLHFRSLLSVLRSSLFSCVCVMVHDV